MNLIITQHFRRVSPLFKIDVGYIYLVRND